MLQEISDGGSAEPVTVSSMEFSEEEQGNFVLSRLRQQRANEKYCDMVLKVESRIFKAHRNILAATSEYFDTMCNTDLQEGQLQMATIECTTADAMEQILDYIYTGNICINSENVSDILRGADHFLIPPLRSNCCRFLTNIMNETNCIIVKHLADMYRFRDLLESATQYLRNNFMLVLTQSYEDIMNLSVDQLVELITDDKIRVEKEECIYETVLNWTKHEPHNRRRFFPSLLSHVRLTQLNKRYLATHVENEELVSENSECLKLVAEAKHQTDTTRRSYCPDSPVLQPRKGKLTDVVVITGGVSTNGPLTEMYAYIVDEDRWSFLPGLPSELRFHAAATLNSHMYIAGGSSNALVSNRVHCYNPLMNSWSGVPCMQTPREYLSLAACNGKLYALGGIRWDTVLSAVECYDPETNCWSSVVPMSMPRYTMHIAVVDNRYIYAIGGRDKARQPVSTVEKYDTETGRWTSVLPLPTDGEMPWEFPVVEVHNSKVYVTDLATKDLCYDTQRHRWSQEPHSFSMASMPVRTYFTYCSLNRNIFMFGGWKSENAARPPEGVCVYNRMLGLSANVTQPPMATVASACCVLQVPYEFLANQAPQVHHP